MSFQLPLGDPRLLPPYMSNKLIKKSYDVQSETYHVCKDRSHMFYKDEQIECSCEANDKRFKEDGVTPVDTIDQIPLYRQLASFFNGQESRNKLLYRTKMEQTAVDGGYKDIFDGDLYKRHKHLFQNEHDLALALYTDGFVPHARGSTTMVTFMAVILNLPPDIR